MRGYVVVTRRAMHRLPELTGNDERAAEAVSAAHARIEPRPVRLERVAGTGVVARIRGRDSRRAPVAVRGDIDALPISEETGLPFASEHPGVMHACGHDVHATWTVGAAHLLTACPAAGDVLIVLQPAEETGRGAQAVLESGALDGVAAIFGAHVDRRFAVGEVVAQEGPPAASHRLRGEVTIELGPPPLVNPPGPAAWARRAAVAVLGDAAVVPLGFVNMGGEDFAAYLERLPGCFLRIGAREPGGEPIPAHSPRFYAAEESIFVGAAVLAEAARIASDAA